MLCTVVLQMALDMGSSPTKPLFLIMLTNRVAQFVPCQSVHGCVLDERPIGFSDYFCFSQGSITCILWLFLQSCRREKRLSYLYSGVTRFEIEFDLCSVD